MWSLRLKISNWENTKRSAAVLFALHVARVVYLSSSLFARSSGYYFSPFLSFFFRGGVASIVLYCVVLYIACWINMWSRYRHSYTRTHPVHIDFPLWRSLQHAANMSHRRIGSVWANANQAQVRAMVTLQLIRIPGIDSTFNEGFYVAFNWFIHRQLLGIYAKDPLLSIEFVKSISL